MPGAKDAQKRVSDPMGLKLQTVVSFHVGVQDEPRSSGRVSEAINPGAVFSAQLGEVFNFILFNLWEVVTTHNK